MIWKEKDGISWLEFSKLQPYPIKHGVFLKHGGVSKGKYATLNVGDTVGDDPRAILENKKRIQSILGAKALRFLNQSHSNVIIQAGDQESADGFITDKPAEALGILHADCQAAIIYDPEKHVLANVHAGWRGQVRNIYFQAIRTLMKVYDSHPKDLIVCISPSLGPQYSEFVNYKEELPPAFLPFQHKPNFFDLWAIAKWQFEKEGVLAENIEIANLCTYEEEKDFFSYRRNQDTGRHVTAAMLVSKHQCRVDQ